jgi:hypothetical protein
MLVLETVLVVDLEVAVLEETVKVVRGPACWVYLMEVENMVMGEPLNVAAV